MLINFVTQIVDLIVSFLSHKFSIPTAVKMLTEVPAEILKIRKGKLVENYDADIIVFDEDINVSNIFINGKKEQ